MGSGPLRSLRFFKGMHRRPDQGKIIRQPLVFQEQSQWKVNGIAADLPCRLYKGMTNQADPLPLTDLLYLEG